MLEFLKKIFQNEEVQETRKSIDLSLQSIEEWLNEKSKPLMEEAQHHVEDILMKVDEGLQRTRFNIEVLENAKLQNPNIPFKAKQYMEGNRKAYIRAVNSFLGHMEINNKDYFYLLDFCKLFDELLNDLNKGTVRSYTILQEFFAHETNKIAHNIKNFDTLFKQMKSVLNGEKIVAVNNLRQKINSLKAKIKQKINLSLDLKSMEAELKSANDEKESLMLQIEKFNESDENKNFLRMNDEKKNKISAFFNDKNQVLQSFSVLERPLRKYSHVAFEHEEIVLDYLKEPIEELANDKDLVILEIFKNLGELLHDDKLQVDEKKKEKAFEEIKKLDKEYLIQFLKRYSSFKTELQDLENKITASKVQEKLRDFSKRLEDANMKIEKVGTEVYGLRNEEAKSASAISMLTSDIESSISEIFGEEIRINA